MCEPVAQITQPAYEADVSFSFPQRVYGITTATVKVGYEYSGCSSVMWNIQTTKVMITQD